MGCQLVPMGLPAGAGGLCLRPVCWLRGSGVTWVVWGAGIWLRTLALSVCTTLRPPTHPLLLAPLCPPAACSHPSLPALFHHPPAPACILALPVLSRCLHLPTRRLHPLLPCLLLPTGSSHPEVGRRVPPLSGVLIPRATRKGDRDGDRASAGHVPSSCAHCGGWRGLGGHWGLRGLWVGERGAGCLTAHSSQLPAPAAGAKPDWILNWKINLDSYEPQPLPSPCARDPAAHTPCLPRLPAPSYRWGN